MEEVFRTLATESLEERRHNPGLEPGRADVIVGGVIVMVTILRTMGFDELLVSEADILDGLVRSLVAGDGSANFSLVLFAVAPLTSLVQLEGFVAALQRLSGDDIRALTTAIDEQHETVADEVAAWEAVMCIDDALRQHGRSRDRRSRGARRRAGCATRGRGVGHRHLPMPWSSASPASRHCSPGPSWPATPRPPRRSTWRRIWDNISSVAGLTVGVGVGDGGRPTMS